MSSKTVLFLHLADKMNTSKVFFGLALVGLAAFGVASAEETGVARGRDGKRKIVFFLFSQTYVSS